MSNGLNDVFPPNGATAIKNLSDAETGWIINNEKIKIFIIGSFVFYKIISRNHFDL